MGRYACLAVLGACLDQAPLTVDTPALDLPRGAGADLVVERAGQPLPLDDLRWLVDDESIATVARTSDGARLRISAVAEGSTAIHLGSQGEVVDVFTHVSPAITVH